MVVRLWLVRATCNGVVARVLIPVRADRPVILLPLPLNRMFCSCLVLEAFPTRGFCSHCLGIPMKKLFLPAESLMNRLSYPIKTAALGLLVFLAFARLMPASAEQLN